MIGHPLTGEGLDDGFTHAGFFGSFSHLRGTLLIQPRAAFSGEELRFSSALVGLADPDAIAVRLDTAAQIDGCQPA